MKNKSGMVRYLTKAAISWLLLMALLVGIVPAGVTIASADELDLPAGNNLTEWEANALLAGAGTSVVQVAMDNHFDDPNTDPYGMCGGNSHLQGIAVDDELKYMFFSYTSALAIIEIKTGELVASIGGFGGGSFGTNGGAHLGCIDYYDGYIYGSLEYKSPGKKFYLAIFDVERMLKAGVGVSIQDPSYDWDNPICTAVLLEEPTRDFRDPVDTTLFTGQDTFGHATNEANNGHWLACSGIDGVSMGKWPGGKDDEIYMIVAYGVYQFSSSPRNDNTYNVLQFYKLSDIWNEDGSQATANKTFTYQDGVSQDWAKDETIWQEAAKTLYVYTGNTSYGSQNIEYEWDTGDIVLYTYGNTDGMGGSYWEVDGSVEPTLQTLNLGQHSTDEWAQKVAKAYAKYPGAQVDKDGYMMGYVGTLKCVCGKPDNHTTEGTWPTGAPKAGNFICSASAPASATTGIAWIGPDPTDANADWFYVADSSYGTGLFKRVYSNAGAVSFSKKVWLAEEPLDAEPVMHWTMDADDMADGVMVNAVDENTYAGYYNNVTPAKGYDGKDGGSLYFDGDTDTLDYSRVWMGDEGIELLQTLLDGGKITISYWYKPEYAGAANFTSNWSPILGIYSDARTVQPGQFVLVTEDRSGALNMCMNNYGAKTSWPVDIRSKGTSQHHSTDWHHIVMTVNLDANYPSSLTGGTSLYREFYVDGMKVGQDRALYPQNKDTTFDLITDFEIGGAPYKCWSDSNVRGRFSGWIDDVKIYDVSVTDKQAAYLLQHTPVTTTKNYVAPIEETPVVETTYVFLKENPADLIIEWNEDVTTVSGLDSDYYTVDGKNVTLSADWLMQRQPGVTTVKVNDADVSIYIVVDYNPIVWYKTDATDASGYGMNAKYYNGVKTTDDGMEFRGYDETLVNRIVLDGSDYLDKAIGDSATLVFTFRSNWLVGNITNLLGLYDGARPGLVAQFRDTGGERTGSGSSNTVQFAAKVFTEASKAWNTNVVGTAADYSKLDNAWHTVAAVYDGSKLAYYLDGNLISEADVADGALDGVSALVLGGPVNRNYATEISNKSQQVMTNFYGTLKNVAVYNAALTAAELTDIYTNGVSVAETLDTSGLNYLLEQIEALTEAAYTDESWEDLEDAMAAAEAALANTALDLTTLDKVSSDLLEARNDLVLRANKDALKAAIAEAKALTEADYTTATWAELVEELEDAEAVVAKIEALQVEVDAAEAALEDAMEDLVKRGDKTDLNALIAEAKALTAADYTESTWTALQTALTAADAVAANIDAVQADVDNAEAALQLAVDNLVSVKDLAAVVADAEALQKRDYTTDTWKNLEDTLAASKKVLADAAASKGELKLAEEKLADAIADLVKRGDKTPLEAMLAEIAKLGETKYNAESWADLMAEVEEAEKVLDNIDATDADIAKACEELGEAVDALEDKTLDHITNLIPSYVPVVGGTDEEKTPVFTDVGVNDWFYDDVYECVGYGLFNGTSATTFSPKASMNRAMVWTVLARMDGVDTTGGSTWYAKGQAWAKAEGISDGTNPTANVTREQLVTMLYRYEGSPAHSGAELTFADAADVSDWALDAVTWAVEEGLLNGKTGNKLDPQGNATRAEVAAILVRLMNA